MCRVSLPHKSNASPRDSIFVDYVANLLQFLKLESIPSPSLPLLGKTTQEVSGNSQAEDVSLKGSLALSNVKRKNLAKTSAFPARLASALSLSLTHTCKQLAWRLVKSGDDLFEANQDISSVTLLAKGQALYTRFDTQIQASSFTWLSEDVSDGAWGLQRQAWRLKRCGSKA